MAKIKIYKERKQAIQRGQKTKSKISQNWRTWNPD